MACSDNHPGCPCLIKNKNKTFIRLYKTFIRPDFVSKKTSLRAGEFNEIIGMNKPEGSTHSKTDLMSIIQMSVGLDYRNFKLMS